MTVPSHVARRIAHPNTSSSNGRKAAPQLAGLYCHELLMSGGTGLNFRPLERHLLYSVTHCHLKEDYADTTTRLVSLG